MAAVIDISAMLNPGEKAIAFQVDRGDRRSASSSPRATHRHRPLGQQITVLQETADSAANPDGPPRFEEVAGLEDQRTVKAILQNKRVLYVSDTQADRAGAQTDTNGDGVIDENDAPPAEVAIESVVIVFAGTDQDAEVIKFAQRDAGSCRASDRDPARSSVIRHLDDEVEETTGITIDLLVDGVRPPDPGHRRAAQRGAPAP